MKKNNNKLKIMIFAVGSVLMSATPCFADDILDNAKQLIADYYDTLAGLAIGIGMLLAVVALIVWFVFPSDKGAETGKKWFIRILLCIAIILSLGGILSLIQNLTSNSGFNANDYVNTIPKAN